MIEVGMYKIEWFDDDHLKITSDYGHERYICGGDFESFLGAICGVTIDPPENYNEEAK